MNSASSGFDPLDDLIESYLERRRRGERPSHTEYAERHPELADRIRDLFPALLVIEEIGSDGSPSDPSGAGRGPVPERLGDYRLLRRVGCGGMGIVYEAIQESLGRHVALKTLESHHVADPGRLERFRREARAAARLHHPHIVPVYGIGEHDGLHFYAMQFIRGHGLDAVLREVRRMRGVPGSSGAAADDRRSAAALASGLLSGLAPVPTEDPVSAGPPEAGMPRADREGPRETMATTSLFTRSVPRSGMSENPDACYSRNVARIGVEAAEALEYAHQEGILHRDIKPANLLLDAQGQIWIADFGLAKAQDSDELTRTGDVVGTLKYMAPERFNGWSDPRSDVYALGATLYELLTLRPAFDESDRLKLVERVLHEDPPPLRQIDRRIPRDLETIVLKAMAREPGERYPAAGRLAEDLRRFAAGQPILAAIRRDRARAWRWIRRNPLLAGAAALVGASLAAVAVIATIHAARQREFAAEQYQARRSIALLADQLGRSLADSRRLLAIRNFDRGLAAFEKDQLGPGLLWMIESWRSALEAGDPAWQHAARANLAAWQPQLTPIRGVLSHDSPVDAAAFSPDGRYVLTGGDDQVARLWDAATARPVGPPLRHRGTVHAVAFSPDGRSVVTGSADRTARIWDRATGLPVRSPLRHDGEVRAVAVSPDGKTILTGGTDRAARRWDAATGQPVGAPIRHPGAVVALAFSPDGTSFITADDEGGSVRRWDSASGSPVGASLEHGPAIRCLAFSPDGRAIVTGTSGGATWLWEARTGILRRRLMHRHESAVRAVAFSPDGRTILTSGTDRTAQLWDAATDRPIGPRIRHEGPVVAVAFRPDGRMMLTASSDSTVRIHEARPPGPAPRSLQHGSSVASVAIGPDARTVVTGGWDGTARRWDAATGRTIGRPMRHGVCVSSLAISPDGATIVTGAGGPLKRTERCTARLWDAATGRTIGDPMAHEGAVTAVAFSPDGRIVLTGGQDKVVRLWDAQTGAPVSPRLVQPGAVDSAAFSPDGRTFVAGYDSGEAQLWDVASRTPRGGAFPHPGAVSAVAFSPGGETLLTGCEDNKARLWDVGRRSLRVPPLASGGWIFNVAFSPDGRTVLTGSREDAAARLWDSRTGMPLGPPLRHFGGVTAVAFSPDGRMLATGSFDGQTRLFPAIRPVPDDLDRVASWVGVITGLALDSSQGAIGVLDGAAWRDLRSRLEQRGGPPEMIRLRGPGWADPVPDSTARLRPTAVPLGEPPAREDRWSSGDWIRLLAETLSNLIRRP